MREWLSWWSTTLPRLGSRVRVPSRAFILSSRFLLDFFNLQEILSYFLKNYSAYILENRCGLDFRMSKTA